MKELWDTDHVFNYNNKSLYCSETAGSTHLHKPLLLNCIMRDKSLMTHFGFSFFSVLGQAMKPYHDTHMVRCCRSCLVNFYLVQSATSGFKIILEKAFNLDLESDLWLSISCHMSNSVVIFSNIQWLRVGKMFF